MRLPLLVAQRSARAGGAHGEVPGAEAGGPTAGAEASKKAYCDAEMGKAFGKKEPETEKGMEGVKTLRDFYKSSGVQVTSGERKGAAGGVIGRLEAG
eukprot:Skav236712  [mRNA]  locus=scaffold2096:13125:20020:+ [translate_table: standard]